MTHLEPTAVLARRPVDPGAPRRSPAALVGLPLAGAVGTVLAWWLGVLALDIQSFLIPTPDQVAVAFADQPGYLLAGAWITLQETVQGFALTVLLGMLVGVALTASRTVKDALYPVLVGLNAVPKLAFAPLLLVWLGFGQGPKVVMAVLMCFFPIVLSTATGLLRTPAELVELAHSLSASRWQTFITVRLPSALPQIFVGLKTAMPLAVIGALVGELFGAKGGLGFIIQNAGSDNALAFAAIALLAVMSVLLFYILVVAERLLLPWVTETTA